MVTTKDSSIVKVTSWFLYFKFYLRNEDSNEPHEVVLNHFWHMLRSRYQMNAFLRYIMTKVYDINAQYYDVSNGVT